MEDRYFVQTPRAHDNNPSMRELAVSAQLWSTMSIENFVALLVDEVCGRLIWKRHFPGFDR